MYTDPRGRLRFTHKGVRYEINKDGELRAYDRGTKFKDSERATSVTVTALDNVGMSKLYRAVGQFNINRRG